MVHSTSVLSHTNQKYIITVFEIRADVTKMEMTRKLINKAKNDHEKNSMHKVEIMNGVSTSYIAARHGRVKAIHRKRRICVITMRDV